MKNLKKVFTGSSAIGYNTYYLNTTAYPDGSTVEVKAILIDKDGFSSSDVVYVKPDNTAPWGYIVSPENNSYVGSRADITIDVGDAQAFSYAELYINDTIVYNTTTPGLQNASVDLSSYPYNSTIEAKLVSHDEAGNTNTTVYYYRVDNLGPTVHITSPKLLW